MFRVEKLHPAAQPQWRVYDEARVQEIAVHISKQRTGVYSLRAERQQNGAWAPFAAPSFAETRTLAQACAEAGAYLERISIATHPPD